MSERENLPRIERQLRLYEMVCQYVIVQFSEGGGEAAGGDGVRGVGKSEWR